jgi:SAM-dependent methyltransferase
VSTSSHSTALRTLLDEACLPYRPAGRFAWRFARGKLGGDPAFKGLLQQGLIPDQARVLDLGCGQGLLASWLATARLRFDAAQHGHPQAWPANWPAAPRLRAFHGIELMPRDVARAQSALSVTPFPTRFTQGDICDVPYEPCEAVVILDVLHYIPFEAQNAVLQRVWDALTPGGVLLLRVGDASAGLPFHISTWVDHVVTWVRGHRLPRLYCRAVLDWCAQLQTQGFAVKVEPMHAGTPFANILLVARKPA